MRRLARRSWLRILLALALLALASPLWLPAIGLALVVADPLAHADALVPLAGGANRVKYAAELFQAGYADWLVASDVAPSRGPDGGLLSRENATTAIISGVPATALRATERQVFSTYTEAEAIRELAHRAGWRSLIIVTSPQHTRRAQAIFRTVFADDPIVIIVRPVVGYSYRPTAWWEDKDERWQTLLEYVKLLAFYLGYRGS